MDKDFAVPLDVLIGQSQSPPARSNQESLIHYIQNNHDICYGKTLDVGEINPMCMILKRKFGIEMDNTKGDLDVGFTTPHSFYDTIIMSHVIEHLMNPLYCLLRLKDVLKPKGILIIATPWCSENLKINWDKGHYHEIDEYRMNKLAECGGFKIVDKKYYPRTRGHYRGIRSTIKKMTSKTVIYKLEGK